MENIWLFLGTVILYSTLTLFIDHLEYNKPLYFRWKRFAKQVAIIALLVLPLNINGNIITIAGNAIAEKNIFSFFSLYQKAGHDAFAIFSIIYQEAERDTVTMFGLTYQKAGRDTVTGVGLAGYQKAVRDTNIGIGLAGYQSAEREATSIIAIALYQRVGEKTRTFGAFSSLKKD